jgi:hypothetical protein
MMHTINVKYLLPVFILAFFVAPLNQTADLDDWKESLAASKSGKGCESIPYSTHRAQCISNSARVAASCKTEAWSCDELGTKGLKATMTALSGHIGRLKEQKKQLESQRSRATSPAEKTDLDKKIADVDKQISEKSRTLDGFETKLANDLVKIKDRLSKGGQCLDARTDVQSVFKSAGDAARRESARDIKVIADSLIDYWEKKRDEHQKAFENVKLGIDKCNKSRDGLL